jgi:hypothetical protein
LNKQADGTASAGMLHECRIWALTSPARCNRILGNGACAVLEPQGGREHFGQLYLKRGSRSERSRLSSWLILA